MLRNGKRMIDTLEQHGATLPSTGIAAAITNAISDVFGGPEEMGRAAARDFQMARDAGADMTVLGWHKLLLSMASVTNGVSTQNVESLSEEDLRLALSDSAVERMRDDPKLRELTLKQIADEFPEEFAELCRPRSIADCERKLAMIKSDPMDADD